MLASLLSKPLTDPEVDVLLLTALYQLQWTRAPAHAVVDGAGRAVVLLRKGSAKGLVNAVLRRFLRERTSVLREARARPSGRFSYPQWWIDEIKRAYPQPYAEILDSGNQHPPMTLRVNQRRVGAERYLELLTEAGMSARMLGRHAVLLERPVPVEKLPRFTEGWVSVQDLAAQRAAEFLDLCDGQRVLDACAAPGGKAAHILESAHVALVAVDRDAIRLERVQENLTRLCLQADLIAADAADLPSWWDGRSFDRILLDAPCSASGIVRRHPDIKWLRRPEDVVHLAAEQARLLAALWQTLAPGGKLLYATCSLFPAENQLQLERFLGTHKNAQRLPIPELAQTDGQLLPDSCQDGFFYALLQKLDD